MIPKEGVEHVFFPPFHQATGDDMFVESLLESMDREFQFWLANRTEFVTLKNKEYRVAVYNVEVDGPRPGKCSHCLDHGS